MSAASIRSDAAAAAPTQRRVKALTVAARQAIENLRAGVRHAGLPAETTMPLGRLVERFWKATVELHQYDRGRILRLERALRQSLARSFETPAARAGVLTAVYGKRGRRRDLAVLLDAERLLVEDYRRMDGAGRVMLRTLCARLAASSEPATKGRA